MEEESDDDCVIETENGVKGQTKKRCDDDLWKPQGEFL